MSGLPHAESLTTNTIKVLRKTIITLPLRHQAEYKHNRETGLYEICQRRQNSQGRARKRKSKICIRLKPKSLAIPIAMSE
jgi:hypothetical protein